MATQIETGVNIVSYVLQLQAPDTAPLLQVRVSDLLPYSFGLLAWYSQCCWTVTYEHACIDAPSAERCRTASS